MARKRMISPEIWESSSFSKLSDFAKLVFIGLISNADDSGKGKANPSYIRSRLFPNDEDRRVTDIKKALSEIALTMSITFYEVNGDSFYLLTNWQQWQKIDRPTPSKIPEPPKDDNFTGERGRYTQNQELGNDSTNIRRGLDEDSSPNRIEKNRIERNRIPPLPPKGGEGEVWEEKFFEKYPKLKGLGKYRGIEYKFLYEHFEKSEMLQTRYSAKWVYENYSDIIAGVHDEALDSAEYMKRRAAWYEARRGIAESNVSMCETLARGSENYEEALAEVKRAEIAIAKAEAEERKNDIPTLQKAYNEALARYDGVLDRVGISREDLKPHYHCTKCSDTGFLPDGRACNCYEEAKENVKD